MARSRRNCDYDYEYERDNMENKYAKKGAATTGIVLGGVALGLEVIHGLWDMVRSGRRSEADMYCRQQTAASNNGVAVGLDAILPALMAYMAKGSGNNETATLRAENAQLKSEKYTDGAVLDLYQAQQRADAAQDVRNNGLFRESFDAIAKLDKDAAVAAAVGEEQRKCLNEKVARLQTITELQSKELCEVQKNEAVNAERLKALAHAVKDGDERNREEFHALLHRERDARQCWEKQADMRFEYEQERRILGDKESKSYADCNFVRNRKVLDASQICPDVVTEVEYLRGLANYYQAGGKDPAVVPRDRVCCPK